MGEPAKRGALDPRRVRVMRIDLDDRAEIAVVIAKLLLLDPGGLDVQVAPTDQNIGVVSRGDVAGAVDVMFDFRERNGRCRGLRWAALCAPLLTLVAHTRIALQMYESLAKKRP